MFEEGDVGEFIVIKDLEALQYPSANYVLFQRSTP